jgi:hypothetical protein
MLQPPRWCKDAVPTPRGWADATTGELLISTRLNADDIDAYINPTSGQVVFEEVVHEAPTMLHEAPVGNKSLEDMTKTELVALAEATGVDVKKSATKAVLIEALS